MRVKPDSLLTEQIPDHHERRCTSWCGGRSGSLQNVILERDAFRVMLLKPPFTARKLTRPPARGPHPSSLSPRISRYVLFQPCPSRARGDGQTRRVFLPVARRSAEIQRSAQPASSRRLGEGVMGITNFLWRQLPDKCSMPHCSRLGVRGNESIVDERLMCDQCHAIHLLRLSGANDYAATMERVEDALRE
jgi:hypothetical protein